MHMVSRKRAVLLGELGLPDVAALEFVDAFRGGDRGELSAGVDQALGSDRLNSCRAADVHADAVRMLGHWIGAGEHGPGVDPSTQIKLRRQSLGGPGCPSIRHAVAQIEGETEAIGVMLDCFGTNNPACPEWPNPARPEWPNQPAAASARSMCSALVSASFMAWDAGEERLEVARRSRLLENRYQT